MRVERIYDWGIDTGLAEHDPRQRDPSVRSSGTVRVGHLSDTHLGKGKPGARRQQMRRWLESFEGLDADVIVHSGDLVEDPGDEDAIEWAFSLMDELDVPVVGVPGNHDVKRPGEPSEVTRRFGEFPRVETYGQLQICLVDSMAWPSVDDREAREHDAAEETGFYSAGGVGPTQRDELAAQLDADFEGPRVFVAHHHPRQPVPPKPWYEQNADLMRPLDDADEVLEMLRDYGISLMLHGHRHQYVPPYVPFDELVVLNCDSSTRPAPPQRARLVDITGDGEAMRIWELVRF